MVKQLRCPIFSLMLSCAVLRWNRFVEIISKRNSLGLSLEEIEMLKRFILKDVIFLIQTS